VNGVLERSRHRRSIPVALQWCMIGFSLVWSCVLVVYGIRRVIGADLGTVAFYTPSDLVTTSVQPNSTEEIEEIEEIERITSAASAAYDRVAAAALRRTQEELNELRAAYATLLERSRA
jgi:hypothetical protein